MTVTVARTRTVVFRIPREDYERFECEAAENGFARMTDYVRARLMRAVGEPTLEGVGRKLGELELAMQQLAERVERT